MHDVIPLDRLDAGELAHVVEIMGGAEQVQRIRELGFHHGTAVQMVRSGSPCIVRISGQTLCFRANDLLSVLVQRAPVAAVVPATMPAPRLAGVPA